MATPGGRSRRLTLWPLVAATYFIVSGGPYGLEELVAGAGFRLALVVLVVVPIVWSLPTALMVGELAAALPEEGGYYAWVRRALGPFAGFMEAWLSLAASVFDMAIYPTLFALYLARLWPALGGPEAAPLLGAAMIAVSAAWNLRGAGAVGRGALGLTVVMLTPFAVLAVAALTSQSAAAPLATISAPGDAAATGGGLMAAVSVAMWNYMGWDNTSTFAGEVDRPQRNYPLAMAVALMAVAITYVIPVAAAAHAGVDARGWTTGSWVAAGEAIGGRWLGVAVAAGGVVSAVGMFNALLLSYSRLPVVLAEDGYLPAFLARRSRRRGAPVAAIVACAAAYALALGLGFRRLVLLDVGLYGLSLVLEFAALVVLRVREPALPRPFRVPGGTPGAVLLGVAPTLLLVLAASGVESAPGGVPPLALGGAVLVAGAALYAVARRRT